MENRIILKDLFCGLCSLQFNKKYVFNLHMSLVHGKSIKIKKEPMTLENEMDLEKITEKQSFQCEICQASFKHKQGLKRHNLSVHEGKKPFKCEICIVSFAQKSALKNISRQFMKEINLSNVNFVIPALPLKVLCIGMLNQFMKEINHSNVTFVVEALD